MITWTEALEAMYGHQLNPAQAKVWEHYLREMNTSSAEIVPAIEMAASENIKPAEWRVTVRDIRNWVRIYRKRQRASADSDQNRSKVEAHIAESIGKLKRGVSKEDVYEVTYALPYDICKLNEIASRIESGFRNA